MGVVVWVRIRSDHFQEPFVRARTSNSVHGRSVTHDHLVLFYSTLVSTIFASLYPACC